MFHWNCCVDGDGQVVGWDCIWGLFTARSTRGNDAYTTSMLDLPALDQNLEELPPRFLFHEHSTHIVIFYSLRQRIVTLDYCVLYKYSYLLTLLIVLINYVLGWHVKSQVNSISHNGRKFQSRCQVGTCCSTIQWKGPTCLLCSVVVCKVVPDYRSGFV